MMSVVGFVLLTSSAWGLLASGAATNPKEEEEQCISQYACNVQGPNLLGFFTLQQPATKSVQESIHECQNACQTYPNCTHFTWYDDRGVFPNTCYLYASCPSRNTQCQDCFSGLRDCAPAYKSCPAVDNDYGGTWFCFPEMRSMSDEVDHGTRCIFQCPQHTTYHVCQDGQWSRPPGDKMCTCPPIGGARDEGMDGKMLCWPPQNMSQPAHPGAYCIHACHGHPKHEFHCHHGQWTTDPQDMTCHIPDVPKSAPLRLEGSRALPKEVESILDQSLKKDVEQMMRKQGHDPATFGRGSSHHSFKYFQDDTTDGERKATTSVPPPPSSPPPTVSQDGLPHRDDNIDNGADDTHKPEEGEKKVLAFKYTLLNPHVQVHNHPVHKEVIKDYQVTQLPPQSVSHLPRMKSFPEYANSYLMQPPQPAYHTYSETPSPMYSQPILRYGTPDYGYTLRNPSLYESQGHHSHFDPLPPIKKKYEYKILPKEPLNELPQAQPLVQESPSPVPQSIAIPKLVQDLPSSSPVSESIDEFAKVEQLAPESPGEVPESTKEFPLAHESPRPDSDSANEFAKPEKLLLRPSSPAPNEPTTTATMAELENDLSTLVELYESLVSKEALADTSTTTTLPPSVVSQTESPPPIHFTSLPPRPTVRSLPLGMQFTLRTTHSTTQRPLSQAFHTSLPPRPSVSELPTTPPTLSTFKPRAPVGDGAPHFESLPQRPEVSQLTTEYHPLDFFSTTEQPSQFLEQSSVPNPQPIDNDVELLRTAQPSKPNEMLTAHTPSLHPRPEVRQLTTDYPNLAFSSTKKTQHFQSLNRNPNVPRTVRPSAYVEPNSGPPTRGHAYHGPQLAVGTPDPHSHLRGKPNFHQVGNSASYQYFQIHDPRQPSPNQPTFQPKVIQYSPPTKRYSSPYTTKRIVTKVPKNYYEAVPQTHRSTPRPATIATPKPTQPNETFHYFTPRGDARNNSLPDSSTPEYSSTSSTTSTLKPASTTTARVEDVKTLMPRANPVRSTQPPTTPELDMKALASSSNGGQASNSQLLTPEAFYSPTSPQPGSAQEPLLHFGPQTQPGQADVKALPPSPWAKGNPFLKTPKVRKPEITTEHFSTPLYRSHVNGVIFDQKNDKPEGALHLESEESHTQMPLIDDIQAEAEQVQPFAQKSPRLSNGQDFRIVKPVSTQNFLDFGTFELPPRKKKKRKILQPNESVAEQTLKPVQSKELLTPEWSRFQIIKQSVNVIPDEDWTPKFPNFPSNHPQTTQDPNEPPMCLHPAPATHGRIQCQGPQPKAEHYIPGSHCELFCDPGYASPQRWVATCGEGGAWHSSVPLRCEETIALLIGGWNQEEGTLADVEVFDAKPDSTCHGKNLEVAPLPQARRGLTAGWIDGSVIACGGVNDTEELNLCWRYNPQINHWSPLEDRMSTERHFAGYEVVGSKLYALGGRDGRKKPMAIGSTEFLDPSWKWQSPEDLRLSQERAYHCATSLNEDTLIITGGYSYNSVVGMSEMYNLTTHTKWNSLGSSNLNQPRYLHACTQVPVSNGSREFTVMVAGGYSSRYLSSSEIFDPDQQRWVPTGDMSVPRQGAQMGFLNGMPTIMGGFHSMSQFPTIVEQFDIGTRTWRTLIQEIHKPRRYFALVQVPRSVMKCQ